MGLQQLTASRWVAMIVFRRIFAQPVADWGFRKKTSKFNIRGYPNLFLPKVGGGQLHHAAQGLITRFFSILHSRNRPPRLRIRVRQVSVSYIHISIYIYSRPRVDMTMRFFCCNYRLLADPFALPHCGTFVCVRCILGASLRCYEG